MGKRDLRICYQTLYDTSKSIKTYNKALENMESAVTSIEGIIRSGKGKSVEKLAGKTEDFKGQIKEVKGELVDLSGILDRYIKGMTAIIEPIKRGEIMQVDRDDIYYNKCDIIEACKSVSAISERIKVTGISTDSAKNTDTEKVEKENRNCEKLREIKKALSDSNKEFEGWINKLNDLYKTVEDYEDKDDEFQKEASGLTDKYTDFAEGISRFFNNVRKSIQDFMEGFLVSVKDFFEGLLTIAGGVLTYSCSALEIGLDKLLLVDPPNCSKENFDKGNKIIYNFIKDPSSVTDGILHGITQGVSDAWDTKGAAYGVGYATGLIASTIAADKGLSKIRKAGKASKTIDGAVEAEEVLEGGVGTVEDLLKSGAKSVDDLEGLGLTSAEKLSQAGFTCAEDLLKFGVKSVDDLERLGLTSVEALSKLGISSADDLLRLGINTVDDLEKLGLSSTEALKKIGITDAKQLVEKGIASEKELAKIGIKGVSKADSIIDGLKVIDGKANGKIPVDEFKKIRAESIQNVNSDTITLGKYKPTVNPDGTLDWTIPGNDSYTVMAGDTTYFSLGNDWDVIKSKYNITDDDMFDLFNVPALDDAVKSGKEIRYSHHPEQYGDCALLKEWEYLKSEYGFKRLIKEGEFWYAIK